MSDTLAAAERLYDAINGQNARTIRAARTRNHAAEGALLVGPLVGIVAGERPPANELRTDVGHELLRLGARGDAVFGQPGQVTPDA